MWWAGSDQLDIYVGCLEGGVARRGQPLCWQPHVSLAAGLDALLEHALGTAKAGMGRKLPVRIWLSGALARPFLFGPIKGLKRWTEVEAVAHSMAVDATGLTAPCVVRMQAWPSPHEALAVAINVATRDTIEAATRKHRINVHSIRPWWAPVLNHVFAAIADARVVAIAENDALTLLSAHADHFDTAGAYVPGPLGPQAESLLARVALTSGVTADKVLRVRMSPRDNVGAKNGVPFGLTIERSNSQ